MSDNANLWHFGNHFGFWRPSWNLEKIIFKNGFLGLENIQLDLFYCFLRHLQAKICKFPEFGGHLGKTANRKKCSTFGVWLQTDLDSAAQNLMETIIKVYICLKTRFSYQRLGSKSEISVAGFRRRTRRLSLALSSVVGAIGRAVLRKKVKVLLRRPE